MNDSILVLHGDRTTPLLAAHSAALDQVLRQEGWQAGASWREVPYERTRPSLGGVDWLIVANVAVDIDAESAPSLTGIVKLGRFGSRVALLPGAASQVKFSVVPDPYFVSCAEHALALTLALCRRIVPLDRAVRQGVDEPRPIVTTSVQRLPNWLGLASGTIRTISQSTVGIVGMGEIGLETARLFAALGANILYHKRNRLSASAEESIGAQWVELRTLLAQSDIVSLHLPHTEDTAHIIGAEELALMRPDAVLINTARGGLVSEPALVDALKAGGIAGAGLDVYEVEPLPRESALTRLENVVLAPHVGVYPMAEEVRYKPVVAALSRMRREA